MPKRKPRYFLSFEGRGEEEIEAVCKSFLCASFDVKFIRRARSSIMLVDLTEGLGFHAKGFNTKT